MKKVFAVIVLLLSLVALVGCIDETEPTPEPEKTLVAISIKTAPTQSTYELGATFSADGLVVEAFYSDGSTAILTSSQYTISGFNANQSGAQTITVTSEGKTATFTVVVSDPEAPVELLALQVQKLPYRTMYALGGTFSTDGIVVNALYSDGTQRVLEDGEATFTGFSSSVYGKKTITVAFGGKQTTFDVTVNNFLQESANEVTVNTAINYEGRGITYQETNPYVALNGKTYASGSLMPVWETIGDRLNINFVDVKQANNTTNQFTQYATAGFVGADVINATSTQLSEYGVTGNFLDLSKYLGYMPNLNKFLQENPSVRTSMTSANGGIYYTPYFDGFGEIEQMFLMRIDWVQDILDVASPTFDATAYTPTMTVQKATPDTLNIQVEVANADGTTRLVTKNRTQNILDILAALPTKTGATMAQAFKTYIQNVYGSQGYTNLSDVFVGTDAAYDVDELVALMYVIKANPGFLTREFTTPRTSVEVYFARTSQTSRIRNFFRGLEMYGVRGAFSRYQWAYFDENGIVEDARVQDVTLDAVDQLQRMYSDSLIPSNFDEGSNYDWRAVLLQGSYGFMTYDYNASSTPNGYITAAQTLDPTFRFEAVLPPVVDWFGNGEYFHFSEGTRAVKAEAWGIPKHVESDPVKLARILTLFDQLYDYSSNDAIGNVHLYGPAGWIDGTVEYNGVEIPAISDEAMAEMQTLASGNMINYLRRYVGATMPIGHIRSLGLEFQTLSSQGITGIERINTAVQAGTFRLAGVYESDNPWYQFVPTLFALTANESADIATLTFDDIWTDAQLPILVKYGFTGNGGSVTRETYLTTMVVKDSVNTYTEIYKKALNNAIARVNQ
ncbi:MAG TPA: bacterial Ig-like domain-containing protein [Acholeplasmataceae bacterium]|nr:bacterial Ig-like domain-containing protein [Acholeplasmataceae bacterium]